MRNRFRALAGMIFLGWSSLAWSAAAAFEVGDNVVVSRDCDITRDGRTLDHARFGQIAEIEAIEGTRIWVDIGRCGWIGRRA